MTSKLLSKSKLRSEFQGSQNVVRSNICTYIDTFVLMLNIYIATAACNLFYADDIYEYFERENKRQLLKIHSRNLSYKSLKLKMFKFPLNVYKPSTPADQQSKINYHNIASLKPN